MTILTSDGCTSVSHKVLQMFSPLFSDMGTGVGPSREEDVMIVNLPDFRSATVDLFMELLLSGQIEDGNEDTKEDVVHLATILGIQLKLEEVSKEREDEKNDDDKMQAEALREEDNEEVCPHDAQGLEHEAQDAVTLAPSEAEAPVSGGQEEV